jgi:beta-lactam-binding protein with PASTA domain
MAKGLEQSLREMLTDPALAAAQLDLALATALGRQRVSFRQRAGAAVAQLERARQEGADASEIAALEAVVAQRNGRLEAAEIQARTADIKRPAPALGIAQIMGLADAAAEKPPLTLAALSASGEIEARAQGRDNGTFHLTHVGDLKEVTLQVSDAGGRLLFRATAPVSVAAGSVLYLDIPLGTPRPTPGPVPTEVTMPELTGQSEGVALAILHRLGRTDVRVIDQVAEGQPGIVLAQLPKAGSVLTAASEITLTVRRAKDDPTPSERVMPRLVGDSRDAAERKLAQLKLKFKVELKLSDGPAGRVIAQEPAEGTALDHVKEALLIVSQSQNTLADAPSISVPDLLGKSRQTAQRALKAASLTATISETRDAQTAPGVTKQTPKAGSVVPHGTAVRLTVNVVRKARR